MPRNARAEGPTEDRGEPRREEGKGASSGDRTRQGLWLAVTCAEGWCTGRAKEKGGNWPVCEQNH